MNSKQKRGAIYVRVSTDGQTTENQRRELKAVAERHGWNVVEMFQDRAERPAMRRLLQGVGRVTSIWSPPGRSIA
jgi:DNA invertase Pin-like site-specific DNA recombinase